MIIDGSAGVVSFDVFDTLLWRRVPQPTDMFTVLAARLRATGALPEWVNDAAFRHVRIVSEAKSRSRETLGPEVSLFEIWEAMPPLFGSTAVGDLVAAEVAIEREFTVVDPDVAEIAELAREHGVPIILVSDTYFTEKHLDHLLDRPELAAFESARVFRSQAYGSDKGAGLWDIVIRELGVAPERILHIGDNHFPDVEAAAERGIRAVQYQRIDPEFIEVLERELEPGHTIGSYSAMVDPRHGDFGLTSLRAKALFAGEPPTQEAARAAWRYGVSVMGPVLTGFSEWVAWQAREAGLATVWCPMREGEMLAEMVGAAAAVRGWPVQAKPIWLSRHVTSLAALNSCDTEEIVGFINQRHELTVRQLLETLDLRPGDVAALAGELDTMMDDQDRARRVAVALTETPLLRNRLQVTVTAARERLLAHLRAEGALDTPELALCDLGWGGTIQLDLAKVLKLANIGVSVSAYYLATDDRGIRIPLAGLKSQGYLAESGQPHDASAIIRSPEILEQTVNALCGSLLGFDAAGEPVLSPVGDREHQLVERRAVHEGIHLFQAMWERFARQDDWPLLVGPAARARLAGILAAALKRPTQQEARLFASWQHEDNFGSHAVTKMLPDDLVPALPYLSVNDMAELQLRDAFWPGLIAASDPALSAAMGLLSAGTIPAEAFEPAGERFEAHLRYRTGDGEWHDGPRKRFRINHNGLSFLRMRADVADVHDVAIAIPGRPAIVRVDWIEAVFTSGSDARPRTLRWEQPDDFAPLTFAECTWLGGNMVQFHKPYSAMWLPLADATGGATSSIRVTVGFAMLPESRSEFSPRLPGVQPPGLVDRVREQYRAKGAIGVAAGAVRVAARRLAGH